MDPAILDELLATFSARLEAIRTLTEDERIGANLAGLLLVQAVIIHLADAHDAALQRLQAALAAV